MFTLPFHIEPSKAKVHLKDPIITMGSCFAEEMGEKFRQYKFNILSNPFGVIYNPYSIFKVVRSLLKGGIDPQDLIQHQGVFYHWDFHSSVSAITSQEMELLIRKKSEETKKGILKARWLILSLGTSFIYRYKKSNKIVANCHKIPQSEFEKERCSASGIVTDFVDTYRVVKKANPNLNILLTVSPVRHAKEGLMANSLSKSILIEAVHELMKEKDVYYFPAYEIMIDVLRDYRFYKEDMVHPNDQAINYIWEQFTRTYMDADTLTFIGQWESIIKILNHQPFHRQSLAHQSFIRSAINKLKGFEERIDISTELKTLEKQLVL